MDAGALRRGRRGYARTRRPDPRLRERIDRALGDAATVVDVGAGAGSYEPAGRYVIAIEPSDVMAAQRPPHLAPAVRADAADLPLRDGSVDAALAVLTIHHWAPDTETGVRELRRVARGPVVISLWGHPERALDPEVTAGTSGFARLAPDVRARAVAALRRDLADGEWDRRHGHLRSLDAGRRLLVHEP